MYIFILLAISFSSKLVSGSTFSCGSNSCANQHLICEENESCSLTCTESHSCQNVTITCADNEDCSISCETDDSCPSITVYGSNCSYLEISALGTNSMDDSTIICPENSSSDCVITCYYSACSGSYIEAINTKAVNLTAATDWAFGSTTINCIKAGFLKIIADGYGALNGANIYCPNNGAYILNGKGYSCIIDTVGQWYAGQSAKIYAVEGFNDVILYGPGFYQTGNDILYCMLNYSKLCDIDGSNYITNIHCGDSNYDGLFCDNYLLPSEYGQTEAPTIIPS